MRSAPQSPEDIRIASLNRREVLSRALSALFLSAVAGAGLEARPARADAPALRKQPSGRALTITYPGGPSIQFDPNYYRDHHIGLFMEIYGAAIERFEMRTVARPASEAVATEANEFSAIINIWIADFETFHTRSTEAAYKRMKEDRAHFANTASAVQVDEVRFAVGEARSRIPIGCECLSLLYPAGAPGRWDDEQQGHAFVRGLQKALGREAIRRIELRKGIEELDDGSPTYQGGVNLYVEQPSAFAAAWEKQQKTVESLSAHLCDAAPTALRTTVFGIASSKG